MSPVARSLRICGRNCGTAKAVAAIGMYSSASIMIAFPQENDALMQNYVKLADIFLQIYAAISSDWAVNFVMDATDRKILAELQAEGRLTVTELAERVSLSVAPCHRRLRELERTKAIRGYRAVIDPAAIGLGFEVLVQVTMDREDATTIARFEAGLAEIAEVRHAERLFGDPDYLIRVATADLAAYQELRDEKLAALPGVQRLSSTIVMKRIVDDRPYPVAVRVGERRR